MYGQGKTFPLKIKRLYWVFGKWFFLPNPSCVQELQIRLLSVAEVVTERSRSKETGS